MPYDAELADRLRALLDGESNVSERMMFGGLAFLVAGNMAVAASGQGGLLLRCDPEQTEEFIRSDGVRRMEMRGREMDGWLRVDAATVDADEDLRRWLEIGVGYARSLPAK